MVTAAEIHQRLSRAVELVEDPEDALARGSAPAELFRVAGTDYQVGIIASVSRAVLRGLRPGPADRRRAGPQLPVRPHRVGPARRRCGAARAMTEIAQLWVRAVAGKQPGHGIDDPSFLQPDRPMSAIGG